MASYKSKVLNLWSQDETLQMRIVPEADKVRMFYNNGSLPLEFPYLTTQGENVYQKMSANAQAVLDEKSRAVAAEGVISANLTTESNRAQSAEYALETAFNDEKSRIATQEQFEANERAAEQAARISADNALSATLNAEIQSRQAQDTQHTNDINAENLRAENRENEIEAAFDAYVLSNDSKIGLIDDAHNGYVASNDTRLAAVEAKAISDAASNLANLEIETNIRVSEVARLDSRVDSVLSNIDPGALDSLSEIVSHFQANGQGYADRLTALEAVVAALVEQLGA